MTATAEKTAEPQIRPEAHAEAARRWRARVAGLGEEMAQAQAALDAAEAEAAKAALEGREMPDMAGLESKVRALKRARQMAVESAEQAEELLAAAQRQEAAAAAELVATEMVGVAASVDDTLAELGHHTATLQKLGRRYNSLASAAGKRVRRGSPDISPSALAGALAHACPEIFAALQIPRPIAAQRRPLAVTLAERHGVGGPHLHEVKQ